MKKSKLGWVILREYDFQPAKQDYRHITVRHYWVGLNKWTRSISKAQFFWGYEAKKRAERVADSMLDVPDINCNRSKFSYIVCPYRKSVDASGWRY